MVDGQGCLLPVRHSHRERARHMPSSCLEMYKSCSAESSAESYPNPSSYPIMQQGLSDVVCPCSFDASESNIGELITSNLSKAVTCHCLARVEPAQLWESKGDLVEGVALPSMSSVFDCISTGHSSSFPVVEEVESGTFSIHGELDEVGTSLCMSNYRSVGISRSVPAEGIHEHVDWGNEVRLDLVVPTCCEGVVEEENVEAAGEAVRNCGTYKSEDACMRQYADLSGGKKPSRLVVNSKIIDIEQSSVHTDADGTSHSACTEEILSNKTMAGFSAAQSASLEFACATGCKRPRISIGHTMVGRRGSFRKTPSESHSDSSNQQQQSYLPGLDNESALRCFAFVSLADLGRFQMVCRQYRDLVKSRLIFRLRRMYGMVEHLVFIYVSGAGGWTVYNANRNVWKTLPPANVNPSFDLQDKESLSAGTHVLWLGKEMFDFVYYRYDLLIDSWERGPSMVNPRCLFASAACGEYAYVAGGFGPANNTGALSLLNSAEKYNSVTGSWEPLPPMSTPRHKCSGFIMDGKFYVIGGRDADHQPIMSGEEYNPITGLWRTIPNMYFTPEVFRRDMFDPSPPLVAVVNNQLYAVESTTNILKMYNKHNNTWRNLGYLPVPTDLRNGWGVAFKAIGNRLFVMGDLESIAAFCWQPGPNPTEPAWELLCRRERGGAGTFLYNCAVMTC